MSCTGNPWLKTPALDKIASQGIRFTNAYCTNPVCCPSRFSLQTGLFPSVIGMRENGDPNVDTAKVKSLYSQSIGYTFRNAGYQTYYGGKVHLPLDFLNIQPWGYDVLTHDERDDLATVCADFLMNRKKGGSPFLLVASFINPHDICYDAIRWAEPNSRLAKNTPADLDEALTIPDGISRKEFFSKYCPPLPSNHEPMIGETSSVEGLVTLRPFREIVREKWTDEDWRMHSWAYMRLTERVDALIGIVMNALNKSGLAKSTIVIFTSDHGDNNGSHKLEHKTVFYQEAANIPLLVSCPWAKTKGVVDSVHLVSNGLDLLPTLCDFAGIKVPAGIKGKSLVPLITDPQHNVDWRKHIFIEDQIGYLIHTGRYKYELDDTGRIREMFVDLKTDPGETRNLIDKAKYGHIVDSLRHKLLNHLKEMRIPINYSSLR